MLHPELVLIPGEDLIEVKQQLQNIGIKYKIRKFQDFKKKSRFQIKGYTWPNDPSKDIYLNDIYTSLKLPFFKPEPIELEWDITNCIPHDWTFDDWEFKILDADIKFWFSTDSNFKITLDDNIFITNIVNKCIHEENETLRIYTETLKPTFLHPHIQTLLNYCTRHKEAHINMWCNIKEKLELENQSPTFIKIKKPATMLEIIVDNLNEVIAKEEILEPAATDCLGYFTDKGHLVHFIKLVQRRDKESRENANLLKILIDQIKKMYPFLNESIEYSYKFRQECVKYINEYLKMFQFVSQ